MEENLTLTLDIDIKNKNIYIGEETGAGATYNYKNVNDLANKIKFYLNNYYSKDFRGQENIR